MRQTRRGFSLIEVLIALGIAALAASLILPYVKGNRDRASYQVSILNLQGVAKAMEKHYLEKGVYPVFKNWEEVAAENSPLREYINEVPTQDAFNKKFLVEKSSETEYEFQGLGAPGKLAEELTDYSFINGPKFKQRGKKDTRS